MLSGIEKAAAEAGYNILVAQSNESYEQEVKIVHSFLAARVCGMTDEIVTSISERYIELYEHITGEKFVKEDTSDIAERIEKNVTEYLK